MNISIQQRDRDLLQALHDFDGVLALRQVKEMFWRDAVSSGPMDKRLAKLHHAKLIERPSRKQYHRHAFPEPVIWLGWRGILMVAEMNGIELYQPKKSSGYELRKLAKSLRGTTLRWVEEPRYIQLDHDLKINWFRLMVYRAVEETPFLTLEEWIPEGEFRSQTDQVSYVAKTKDGKSKQAKRGVRPDGYFVILDEGRSKENLKAKARFLLELDNATHPNSRFSEAKAAAGLAYIASATYKERLGEGGRWLVVTTGEKRRNNLSKRTEEQLGRHSHSFLFSTLKDLEAGNVLTDPLWRRAGSNEVISLFTAPHSAL